MLENSDLYSIKCFLFSLKFTKIAGDWGSAPDPAGGPYSTPPDHLAAIGWDRYLYTIKCFLFSLKFTKITGDWAPAYSAPSYPLAVIGCDRHLVAAPGIT